MRRIVIPVIGIFSLVFSISIASARTIEVPGEYQTIQAAIYASQSGDTVLVGPGNYREILLIDTRSLVLGSHTLTTGNPAFIESTIIDGDQQGSVITVNAGNDREVQICGFTLRNGRTRGNGGGVCGTNSRRIQLDDMLITENIADDDFWAASGGGISMRSVSQVLVNRVRIIGNEIRGNGGGGADFREIGDAQLTDCVIMGNESNYMGGGIYDYHCNITMTRVLVANNIGGWLAGGALMHMDGGIARMNQVTFANNTAGMYGGAFYGSFSEGSYLTNSIVFGNVSGGGDSLIYLDSSIPITYCDIEGGNRLFRGDPGVFENVIDQNPQFIDPDGADYNLAQDSPCIDTGDPDADPDQDGSRADMGGKPYLHIGAKVAGVVLNGDSFAPIPDVAIYSERGFVTTSDQSGDWAYDVLGTFDSTRVSLEFIAEGYNSKVIDTLVYMGDSLWIEIGLDFGIFSVSLEMIEEEVDSGSFRRVPLTINNEGGGSLAWSASVRIPGDPGLDPFSVRATLPVGTILEDDRIEGVTYDGTNFYLCGANGDDTNMVYMLTPEGEIINSFPQAGVARYGYKDIDWDGEYLWGAGGDGIYALTLEGEVAISWPDPLNPSQFIAIDRVTGIVWLAGTTTNIVGYDRQGNNLGRSFNRRGLRTYGLGWLDNDPEGAGLHILNRPVGNVAADLHKINVETGDTTFVWSFPLVEGTGGYQSLYLCRNYDTYQGSVLLTIDNRTADFGGDMLQIYQLYQNCDWVSITPDQGELEAGQVMDVDVMLRATADDELWSFEPGVYEGEIELTTDALDAGAFVPITMTVVRSNGALAENDLAPSGIRLASFPNPFNSSTTIRFGVGAWHAVPLRLAVYDLSGRMVADLLDKRGRLSYAASERAVGFDDPTVGERSIVWNAEGLPGGIYLIRLESGSEVQTIKTVLLK